MLFADMGAGEYAPVAIEHQLADHQAIGEGVGSIEPSTKASLLQRDMIRPGLLPRDPSPSARLPTLPTPPKPPRGGQPMPTFPLPTAPPIPVAPPQAMPPPQIPGLTTAPPPMPPLHPYHMPPQVQPVAPPQLLPTIEKTSSNVKWAVIGGLAALGVIGILVVLR